MSRLYLTARADTKNERTTCGENVLDLHARGWDFGVRVTLRMREDVSYPEIIIYLTGGSNTPNKSTLLGTFTLADLDKKFVFIAVPRRKEE
jgi:hypothetical protein